MTYIIYDTALHGLAGLLKLQDMYPLHQSLFKGTKDEMLFDVAPYIFQVDDELYNKCSELSISLERCLLVDSEKDIQKISDHFRKFIYQTINKREYFFRFWDGRVLQKFLPTCEENQLILFFNGVRSYGVLANGRQTSFSFTQYGLEMKEEVHSYPKAGLQTA